MHIGFLNPQGNFDPQDSYWTEHPDFGGQLVYVKEVALAMAALGHRVDIITRRIEDAARPEFAGALDGYPGHDRVRIVRIPCGPPRFLAKENLWPYLGPEWVPGIIGFYETEGALPHFFTAHYADGGLAGAVLGEQTGVCFSFTGHSLGAQKLDELNPTPESLPEIDRRFHFKERILAERIAMDRAARIITSTVQEKYEQYGHPAYQGVVDPVGVDDGRFAVIAPGVNRRVFTPDPGEADRLVEARLETALARDIAEDRRRLPLILCSSRLDRKKNHLGLVRAFAESEELRTVANLAIVVRGLDNPLQQRARLDGEERTILDEIARFLDEHRLWPAVTSFPLNSQAELAAAYRLGARRHSVFALTTLYEPFGLAPLEAMSCGLPAVVTQNGGTSESLYDSPTGARFGVLVDPLDAADISRGLLEVLAADPAWQYYHRAGLDRVASRYTWDRTAEGYLAAIDPTMREPARRGSIPIPPYFLQPDAANEIDPATLSAFPSAGRGRP